MTRFYRSRSSKVYGGGENISSSKYHNEKITYKGETFDSRKEFEYYLILEDRQKSGEITQLVRQLPLTIQEGFLMPDGSKVRPITYIADFAYYENGIIHYVDVKGFKTEVYKLKKKLLAFQGIYIEEV